MATVLELGPAAAARPWWRQRWQVIVGGYAVAAVAGFAFAGWVRSQTDWSKGMSWERSLVVATHGPLPSVLDALMLALPWLGTNITLIPGIAFLVWWLWAKRRR